MKCKHSSTPSSSVWYSFSQKTCKHFKLLSLDRETTSGGSRAFDWVSWYSVWSGSGFYTSAQFNQNYQSSMLQTNSWKKIMIITLCYWHKAVESADNEDQKINKTALKYGNLDRY